MRKLILTATVAILTSGVSVYAIENNSLNNINKITTLSVDDDFKEINLKELPAAVTDAILKDFAAGTVTKAYVNTSEQYKISMIVDEKEKVVFADKEGKWLKEEEVIEEKVERLKI
ncbi:hypothetical protein [Polaribacter sargassicola]|uniref:hypothetical protein n=1 Tax=Polaribacter sargassicola TaxID=2836891 RepID=UPI001F15FE04|nr:hypothetical protein [Polaribacter sp. DS7-9]MCG1036191.1 hypothetical protein [Polaribacter sp. DS7-9]